MRQGTTILAAALLLAPVAGAQQPIGRIRMEEATVSGDLEVTGGAANLRGGATVTAKDHTAQLNLERGGAVRVCATSSLHVSAGGSEGAAPPLLFALDRGAMEIQTVVANRDVVITPDLRFTTAARGPLDLRVRVTRNGDTCVENRGERAPTLDIVEQFGDATYQLRAGQHVFFEHGSLKEVVDHESSPCGCPPVPTISVADAGASAAPAAAAKPGAKASPTEAEHPFPVAQSQGLAPTPEIPQAPPGQVHAQVSTTLSYEATPPPQDVAAAPQTAVPAPPGAAAPVPRSANASAKRLSPVPQSVTPQPVTPQSGAPAAPATSTAQAPPPPAAPGGKDIVHVIGRFFRKIFGGR